LFPGRRLRIVQGYVSDWTIPNNKALFLIFLYREVNAFAGLLKTQIRDSNCAAGKCNWWPPNQPLPHGRRSVERLDRYLSHSLYYSGIS
jgi:hypothetical protein